MQRIAIALLVAVAAISPAQAVERILSFVSDVEVQGNGDLAVTETIRVQAEGDQIRRGILRDFPTTYARPDGSRVVVGFDVKSVTRDGADEAWTTEGMANGVRVRIGRAEVTLSTGAHQYVIRYRTTRQIGFFADYDELYWNATGTGWTFAIDSAEARITLPQPVPFRQSAFYTGPQGARGQDAAIVQQQPGHIVFRTTRALPPGSGLTVAAAWAKGVVAPPSASQQTHWWLQDNLPGVVAGIGLVAVLGFYAFAWARFGRDPPRGTIIPLFGPPDGMSSAAVRFVERMAFDARCFTAAIIDLGVNGHIRLTGDGKQTVIEHRDGGKPIGPPERDLESKLFATKPSLQLTDANYEPLGKAKDALKERLAETYDGTLFTDNYLWSGLGMVLSFLLLVATVVLMIATYNDPDRLAPLLFGMLAPVAPILGGAFLIRAGLRRDRPGMLFIAGGGLLIAVPAFFGLAVMASAGGPVDVLPGIAAYILSPLAFLGIHWLQAPTPAGRGIMDRIEGFRQYLGVAEEDRLNALNPPDKTPELFERFLPCAVALDVENRWARRFASVLAAAGTGAAVSTGMPAAGIGATTRSALRIISAARSRKPSRPHRRRPDRATAAAPAAAAPPAAGVAAAADRGGEDSPRSWVSHSPRRRALNALMSSTRPRAPECRKMIATILCRPGQRSCRVDRPATAIVPSTIRRTGRRRPRRVLRSDQWRRRSRRIRNSRRPLPTTCSAVVSPAGSRRIDWRRNPTAEKSAGPRH
ncbi:MAG TPA: DUF2207 domain-containing protein [Xanthobacteraceae bacterium]